MKSIGNERAFPLDTQGMSKTQSGLTKLEYFSGLALQATLNSWTDNGRFPELADICAVHAVAAAKALIAELSKDQP